MHLLPALVCGALGFVVGGFLQPLAQRTPMRERMGLPASHCMCCGIAISRTQAFPWTARILRINECATCRQALWTTTPFFELVCAFALAAVAARFGWAWALPAYLLFAYSATAICYIDMRHHIIPNRIVYTTLFASVALLGIAAIADNSADSLVRALIGMVGASGFFFIVWFIYPKGMGYGDVRLALLIGLFTGWIGIGNVFLGVMAGLLLGAVSGLFFVVLRFVGMKDPIPYGPFLIAGAFVSIFFGPTFAPVLLP